MGESSGRNGFLSHCLTVIRIDGWTMFLARFASCFPFVDAASTDAEEPAGEHQTEHSDERHPDCIPQYSRSTSGIDSLASNLEENDIENESE